GSHRHAGGHGAGCAVPRERPRGLRQRAGDTRRRRLREHADEPDPASGFRAAQLKDAASVSIAVAPDLTVSGLLLVPERPVACFVLGHGAGAGMTHPFMAAVATGLGERGIATLRYQFPYMERRSRRTDPPPLAQAAVRAAVSEANRRLPRLGLVAG